MQSYREESGSRPLTQQLNPLPPPSGHVDDMSKYSASYEEAMNPFEAFRGRVRYFYSVLHNGSLLKPELRHPYYRKQPERTKT